MISPAGDPKFMAEAIDLSLRNVREGKGGPFGALVVRGDEVIARGTNQVTTAFDPTTSVERQLPNWEF